MGRPCLGEIGQSYQIGGFFGHLGEKLGIDAEAPPLHFPSLQRHQRIHEPAEHCPARLVVEHAHERARRHMTGHIQPLPKHQGGQRDRVERGDHEGGRAQKVHGRPALDDAQPEGAAGQIISAQDDAHVRGQPQLASQRGRDRPHGGSRRGQVRQLEGQQPRSMEHLG